MIDGTERMRALPVVLVAVLATGLLGACGGGSSAVAVSAVTEASATTEAVPASQPSATRTTRTTTALEPDPVTATPDSASPSPTVESGQAVVTSIDELISVAGYPADTTTAVLRIPLLGLSAPVATRYVGLGTAELPLPSGPADIVWYDMSEWTGLGGAPGAGGNAIFSGHVDYADRVPYADVYYRGLGVFANLDLLTRGDVIEVDYAGATLRYSITTIRQLSAAPGATDWGAVWSADVPVDSITLYTCGGAFDEATRSYIDRVVVQAERIGA